MVPGALLGALFQACASLGCRPEGRRLLPWLAETRWRLQTEVRQEAQWSKDLAKVIKREGAPGERGKLLVDACMYSIDAVSEFDPEMDRHVWGQFFIAERAVTPKTVVELLVEPVQLRERRGPDRRPGF